MGHGGYRGRTAVIATRHGKRWAVAPAFRAVLGLDLHAPPGLDTDSLGTFTGDVPRPGSMRETALSKARLGIAATGCPLAVASEGSFGPHPAIPFLAMGRELLAFIDAEQELEIIVEQVSECTNFAACKLEPDTDLEGFLRQVGFPRHALVVRSADGPVKGVRTRVQLDRLIASAGPVTLETDMRAHMNPTRMREIARLAQRLADRIATSCPACGTPGFGVTRAEAGLPCSGCGEATALTRVFIHGCARCPHEVALPRPDHRLTAHPAECPECNP